MNSKSLKPQDLLVLLKLVVSGRHAWTLSELSESLGLSESEVFHALKRSEELQLFNPETKEVSVDSLLDLLVHALKFLSPGKLGKTTKGVATGSSLPELKSEFLNQCVWVWPSSEGTSYGASLQPLYSSAPFAASKDADLHLLLSLVDLVRCEDVGQREEATRVLNERVRDFYLKKRALPAEQEVLANLSDLGAPLVLSEEAAAVKKEFPGEETLVAALSLAHHSPTVARVLPVVFFKQRDHLNFRALRSLAQSFHEELALGFFLDLASELSGERRLSQFAKPLRKKRKQHSAPVGFFVSGGQGKYATQLADLKTPQVARNWGFRMNMDLDSFRSHFLKFAG